MDRDASRSPRWLSVPMTYALAHRSPTATTGPLPAPPVGEQAPIPSAPAVAETNGRADLTAHLPVPRCPRYLSLDIWRGLACLLVLVHHSTFYKATGANFKGLLATASAWLETVAARLWIGVPLFFVISGYCIAATADSSRRRPHAIGNYFIRRFRRIYPPYWILLALTIAVVLLIDLALAPRS